MIVHGSFARGEATGSSDFDYLVVAHGITEDVRVTRDMLSAVDDFIQHSMQSGPRTSERRPGGTGLFGHIASAPGLTERIGLEQDTNVSTTRRLLILEESRSIYQPELRTALLRTILQRYLDDYEDGEKRGVPRFLLNDVMRYWYTLAVDYQAKRWEGADRGWGLRYLKLLISRKLVYAGTVVSLLLCSDERPASVDRLAAEFDKPPLARLLQLVHVADFNQHDALRTIAKIADRFVGFLAAPGSRDKAQQASVAQGLDHDVELHRMRSDAEELHGALQTVLFESSLAESVRRYLVF